MHNLHFLRPWWFMLLVVIAGFALLFLKKSQRHSAWSLVCDPHLLAVLVPGRPGKRSQRLWFYCLFSSLCMTIALAGPTWKRLPRPTFQKSAPRVIVLSLADAMLARSLSPDRLSRAKFTLIDRLATPGPWGMIVYTDEPFVVSPMTLDGQTIAALLPSISPDIMPVGGDNLAQALREAKKLLEQAKFSEGQILVLTASHPPSEAIMQAALLAKEGISTSVMSLTTTKDRGFNALASAGKGEVFTVDSTQSDWNAWLNATGATGAATHRIVLWVDEGRWFLLPALLGFLPLFRRNALQGIA